MNKTSKISTTTNVDLNVSQAVISVNRTSNPAFITQKDRSKNITITTSETISTEPQKPTRLGFKHNDIHIFNVDVRWSCDNLFVAML